MMRDSLKSPSDPADKSSVILARNFNLTDVSSQAQDRRKHGRIRTDTVSCSIGDVVDLSVSGMKVARKGRRACRENDRFTVTIRCGQFALPVDVTVMWVEKTGFRRYLYGLRFEEINPAIQAKIVALARVAGDRRTISTHAW